MKLSLVTPSVEYKRSYIEAVKAFKSEGLSWYEHLVESDLEKNFEQFIEEKTATPKKIEFWAIVDEKFAGKVHIHTELTPELRIVGGHIGYDTAPAFRRKGVATEMLRKILPLAKSLGLIEVLLTCDDNNVGSIKAIEANGGELEEKKEIAPGRPLKRYYWIQLN